MLGASAGAPPGCPPATWCLGPVPRSSLWAVPWSWSASCRRAARHTLASSVTFVSSGDFQVLLLRVSGFSPPPGPAGLLGLNASTLCSSQRGFFKKHMILCISTCLPLCHFFSTRNAWFLFLQWNNTWRNCSSVSFSMVFLVEWHFSPRIGRGWSTFFYCCSSSPDIYDMHVCTCLAITI